MPLFRRRSVTPVHAQEAPLDDGAGAETLGSAPLYRPGGRVPSDANIENPYPGRAVSSSFRAPMHREDARMVPAYGSASDMVPASYLSEAAVYPPSSYGFDSYPPSTSAHDSLPPGSDIEMYMDSSGPYLAPSEAASKDALVAEEDPNQTVLGLLASYGATASPVPEVPADEERLHYEQIPRHQPRRHQTVRRVPLHDGHLVLDCPVPSKLLERQPIKTGREFTYMRYTAVTCDPDEFRDERYTLRQELYSPPRRTELCIVLTMYNEDEFLFARTMHGVMTNIAYLCSFRGHSFWGPEGWKKVVVVIIADGRLKMNKRTLSVLAAMGVYQEGVGKNSVQGKPVEAHLYEFTAQVSVDSSLRFRSKERGLVPVQVLLCIKEHNRKKINSHRWAFNAFGQILLPNVCVLLDVGTKPRARSIYRLWEAFDREEHVAGACGEIVAKKGLLWHALLNPLVAAQNFEYKLSNMLDKPLESALGYITVLPGAFSAYRFEALQNDAMGNGPLCSYFKGETMHGGQSDADIFTSNMYLAEDRILCWELVTKRDSKWLLRYVKRAQAETDVPERASELISQRRRWLNGSFFAAIHAIIKFGYIYRSKHSFFRKFLLHLEILYQFASLVFSWFTLANFFVSFSILTHSLGDIVHWVTVPAIICQYIYVAFLIYCYLLAMGNRPAGNEIGYLVSMVVYGLLMVFMMAAVIVLSVTSIQDALKDDTSELLRDPVFVRIVISVLSTYGLWLIASLLFVRENAAVPDAARAVAPGYEYAAVPTLLSQVRQPCGFLTQHDQRDQHAFCNTHDVSWGTKGSDKAQATDLGSAAGGSNSVDVAMPSGAQDLDDAYEDACNVLRTKPMPTKPTFDASQRQKDYYATVRTNVVLAYTITNAALAAVILNLPQRIHLIYMAVLFYAIAGFALVRLLGTLAYLCVALPTARLHRLGQALPGR